MITHSLTLSEENSHRAQLELKPNGNETAVPPHWTKTLCLSDSHRYRLYSPKCCIHVQNVFQLASFKTFRSIFFNRNDHIVVLSSLLSSGLPDKNHLCAEKPTRSRLIKIKNPCYNPFVFKFVCEILRLDYSHRQSPVYILRLSALKCWRLENERAAPPIKSHRAAGLFHSHEWVVTVASPCAHARLIQLNPHVLQGKHDFTYFNLVTLVCKK